MLLMLLVFQGQFAPVKGNYSAEFRDLVSDMLQRDPDLRPSANDIMYHRLSPVSVWQKTSSLMTSLRYMYWS